MANLIKTMLVVFLIPIALMSQEEDNEALLVAEYLSDNTFASNGSFVRNSKLENSDYCNLNARTCAECSEYEKNIDLVKKN